MQLCRQFVCLESDHSNSLLFINETSKEKNLFDISIGIDK